MRLELAWQPGLTYGNCLSLIINNQPPEKERKQTNNTCKTLPRFSRETEGKHMHTQTETAHTHKGKRTHSDTYWFNRTTSSDWPVEA